MPLICTVITHKRLLSHYSGHPNLMSRQIRVIVWGKPEMVDVSERSKSVWVASGSYMGQSYQTTGRSATQAAGAWRVWATTVGG